MNKIWYAYVGWIAAAALFGFAISAIFAGALRLPRSIYLIPYVALAGLFLYAYVRWSGLVMGDLIRHNWIWGLVGALLLAAFTVKNILSQPVSARSEGFTLAFDLLWSGVIYGLVDALLLSVLPVLATWQAFTLLSWTASWPGKLLVGVIAVFASLLVTAAYHLGYPEYRGGGLFGPAIGNTAMTLGYLITNNPLAAILSHIAMHIAGVLHGPASVVQLPPHYLP
ncbi:MAG: hypothetical protein EHM33_26130 [Chloroflexi bacterium]|nr:MAG: hypothetical protein EHM33_26130 [Chloroflexota bacterium]